MAATTANQSSPFIKQLASSDRRVRDRALSSLRTYLHRKTPFTSLELLKLWKGLFFCMWMSDKPRTQQQLARDLADLLNVLTPENFLGFADAFWKTMAREWSGIDALRMDKFLYLVRCYVNGGFEYIKRQRKGWEAEELVEGYLALLQESPFNARDGKIPNGLRYHVVEIYVDELDKVDEESKAPVERLLTPMRKLGINSPTKMVRKRVKEALEDERLQDWAKRNEAKSDEEEADEDDGMADAQEGGEDEFGGFED